MRFTPQSPGRKNKTASQKRFPQLAHLDGDELRKLIKRSRLSREDRQIAISSLVFGANDADIAVTVHMDRSTVSRHLRNIIIPHLEQLNNRKKEKAGA